MDIVKGLFDWGRLALLGTAAGYREQLSGRMLRLTALAVMTVVFCSLGKGQTTNLPPEMTFLKAFGEVREVSPYRAWDKVTFGRGDHRADRLGRHWSVSVQVPGPKVNEDDAVLSRVKAAALPAGWTVFWDDTRSSALELHYQKDGVEAWANTYANFGSGTARANWEMIEIAPPPVSLTLAEPSATPEKMPTGENGGDFPFLTPIPKSVPYGGRDSDAPWSLKWKNSGIAEIVARGTVDRNYKYPGLSDLLFGTVYHDALVKAGWDVDQAAPNMAIVAHYTRKGRNLWAYLNLGGDSYVIRVGKEGAPDQLRNGLAKDCHVALYGVLFDFNKSTLQPASDGVLQQVASVMTANAALKIEVQGHTDNVGGDAYNQTLSEARAHSVMVWLNAHGVVAARMTAKGYGKTMPVADNSTDDGRAKNRRVEIADPNCKRR
jgi:outer membrane protein OmpA-like peptidoglycan-associated protein